MTESATIILVLAHLWLCVLGGIVGACRGHAIGGFLLTFLFGPFGVFAASVLPLTLSAATRDERTRIEACASIEARR